MKWNVCHMLSCSDFRCVSIYWKNGLSLYENNLQAECSRAQQFTEPEIEAAWERMQDENAVMISDDMLTLI